MKKNKVHLLYVITQGGPWGGAQRYVHDLVVNRHAGTRITVAIGEREGNKALQEKLKASGIDVIQLKHLVRSISPIHDLLATFELRSLYKSIAPNIIHLNSSKAGIIGSLASKGLNISTIYTVHGWVFLEPMAPLRQAFYKFIEKRTAKYKDHFIVLSNKDKQIGINTLKISKTRIDIITHGIDAPKLIPSKNRSRDYFITTADPESKKVNDEKNYWIGSIANFYHTKGLDILLEAFAYIAKDNDSLRLCLVGEGPERPHLLSLIEKLDLENKVILPGLVESASKYLLAFDLFVLPSQKEGLPYALLEAMVSGIPTIATEVGGIPELITHKKTGLLAMPNDPLDLSTKLLYAFDNQSEMNSMAQSAKIIVRPISKMVEETYQLYLSLQQEG